MLEKPNVLDGKVIPALRENYSLDVTDIVFFLLVSILPLGLIVWMWKTMFLVERT